jgi:hypothetical protein
MKQKLFENIGGNTFKLITEGVDEINPNAKLVRSGLQKVFSAGSKSLSYKKVQGVGLGYIKSVEEARKTAIQEARILAKEYGYMDNENSQAFVREDETNMADPAEAKEVQIAKRIIEVARHMKPLTLEDNANTIEQLAMELIQMHGQP